MARQNAELVRGMFDALRRHAYAEAARGFDDDAVWENTDTFPGPRRCVGREAIVDFWTTLVEDFDDGAQAIERLMEVGDIVVVGVHSVARGKTSGAPVDVTWAAAVEVRDGRISRVDVHGDWSNALKAAAGEG